MTALVAFAAPFTFSEHSPTGSRDFQRRTCVLCCLNREPSSRAMPGNIKCSLLRTVCVGDSLVHAGRHGNGTVSEEEERMAV